MLVILPLPMLPANKDVAERAAARDAAPLM